MSLYSLSSGAASFSDLLSYYTSNADTESYSSPVECYGYSVPVCASSLPLGVKCTSTFALEFETDVPPPAYVSATTPKANPPKTRSRLASLFTRRSRRSRSSSPPPPYLSAEEIILMEERLKQLDTFFGGAAL